MVVFEDRRENGQPVSSKMLRKNDDPVAFARSMVALRKPLRLRGRYWVPKDGLYRVATSRKLQGAFSFIMDV